jgi:hypothetical protein
MVEACDIGCFLQEITPFSLLPLFHFFILPVLSYPRLLPHIEVSSLHSRFLALSTTLVSNSSFLSAGF